MTNRGHLETVGETLVVAVISDIHAHSINPADQDAPSYVSIVDHERRPTHHPIEGLIRLIEDEGLSADLLVCAGDIGDSGDAAAMVYAWEALERVRASLTARHLIGTTGNHDLERGEPDPFRALRGHPNRFPIPSAGNENDLYWGNFFLVLTEDRYRVVTLNSAAHHTNDDDFDHGRVTETTVERLREQLRNAGPRPVNILTCHHHPHRHGDVDYSDFSVMEGGHALLDMVSSVGVGRWMVIHGHRHHARVSYAASDGSPPPIVFAAASLTANLQLWGQTSSRNQFYVLEFPIHLYERLSVYGVGTFKAWNWARGYGWQPARNDAGLPSKGGFGHHAPPQTIAQQIADAIGKTGLPFVEWTALEAEDPRLGFLSPRDLDDALAQARARHAVRVVFDQFGYVNQVAI